MKKPVYLLWLLLVINVISMVIGHIQPREARKNVKAGCLYSMDDNAIYWSSLTDFCVQNDYIYLLYGNIGLLKIYNIHGEYVQTLAFQVEKGESRLYSDGQLVYLQDQNLNFYIIQNDRELAYRPYEDYKNYQSYINDKYSDSRKTVWNGNHYAIEGVSLVCQDKNGNTTIVLQRIIASRLIQGMTPLVIQAVGIIALLFFAIKDRFHTF